MQTKSSTPAPAARAFGSSIGNLFLGFFGMAWILLAIMSTGQTTLPVLTVSPERLSLWEFALMTCFLAALVGISIYVMRRTYAAQRAATTPAEQKKIRRWFGVVNLVQWALIFAAASGLGRLGRSDWIIPAIMLIIGIHFFPLARLFKAPLHYLTGSVIVVWAIVYPILFSPGKGDPVGSLGMGLILWATAAFTCWRSLRLLRQAPVSPRL